jgi:hypothetical protein
VCAVIRASSDHVRGELAPLRKSPIVGKLGSEVVFFDRSRRGFSTVGRKTGHTNFAISLAALLALEAVGPGECSPSLA